MRQPPIRLWQRLVRLTQARMREVEATLAPLDLSVTEFDLLAAVRAHGGATQQDIAQHLLFSEANLTYHAQRLCGRGLIRREMSGKAKRLFLTPAGEALIGQALPRVVGLHERQFGTLTPEQMRQLEVLLRLLG
nr:MarR family transcriptional regulator [Deinococcus sp. HSC-46F16]